jgi:hypothetical protein
LSLLLSEALPGIIQCLLRLALASLFFFQAGALSLGAALQETLCLRAELRLTGGERLLR